MYKILYNIPRKNVTPFTYWNSLGISNESLSGDPPPCQLEEEGKDEGGKTRTGREESPGSEGIGHPGLAGPH